MTAAASVVLAGAMVTVYYFLPVMGAAVDVLNGDGNMDDSTQVGAWALTNVSGASSWTLDTSTYFAAPGSGRLESPSGSSVPYEAYVSYSFTTDKRPVSASLSLAYSKQFSNAQPSAGQWNVQAEIWQAGGTSPLQVIPLDTGNANAGWTNLSDLNVTSVDQMDTEYELRLVQKGSTGADPSAFSTTWFDNVQLHVDFDATPPQAVSASAQDDHSVDLVFDEAVDRSSAQNVSNYSINPGLTVTGAALQPDGKTVRLTTAEAETFGTSYTITVNNVADISGNAMTAPGTAVFTGIDTTPPQVASAAPVNDTTVNVIFNEPLDTAAAETTANYSISPDLGVTGAVLQSDQKTVQLTTDRQTWQTNYTVTASNILDLAGNQITGNNSAGFTGLDNTPPTVVSAAAVNDTTVDVVFSEKVDGSTAQTAANYIISGGLAVTNPVLQTDGKTVRLTTTKQTDLTGYTITVNGVRDLAGEAISTGNTASFNGVDTTPPTVLSAFGVSSNTVDVVFGEKVDKTTAEAITNYSISPDLQVTAAVLQSDGVTVELTTSAQTGGERYLITVSGVCDLAQNVIGKYGNSADFYGITPPTNTQPYVLSAQALDNNTVEIKFNATLDPISAAAASNYIISPDLAVTGAIMTGDGVTVRLTTATQTQGTAYTVTVSQVQDIYGSTVDSANNSAAFTGSGVSTNNPHGNYLDNTNQCSGCHVTHNAQGPDLTKIPDQTQACYLCHDAGGQSQYDVADQFGKNAPYANSHHKIPEGTQQCSDCHNPHDGGKDAQGRSVRWPRLLQSSASPTTHSGNDFCFSCHKDPLGGTKAIDPATYPAAGVGHNKGDFIINGTTPFNPESGTGIACTACHEEHGSSLDKLLKVNPTNDTSNVTGDDKSLCYKCHTGASADGRYPGQAVYDNTVSNPHALTTSAKTNVDYPGVTGQAGQCAACHDPHGSADGTAQASMKTLRGVYNDGKTSYSAGDFGLCFGCHNSTSQNGKYDIQTPYSDVNGGHYIKTAGGNLAVGSKMPCEACHTLHGSANNNKYMLKDSLGSNLGDGRNECLACHEAGKQVEGLTMKALPADVPEHTGSATACLNCHGSPHAPTPGISAGGQDCSVCHSSTAMALSSTSSGYHHLITNTAATYSTTQSGSLNCLSCHVDHNKFNNQKAFNLKANYSESFPADDTTPGQNTDFNSADTTYGGLCLSCHQNRQTKSYTQANGSLATPPISISRFTDSAHNYNVFSVFGDSTVFYANCVKCHNDDMSKTKQSSTSQFGTHNSSYQGILSPFDDSTLIDPLKQQFCLKCHSASGDFYGTTMSEKAKQVAGEFGKASKHDITGMTGAQLTCVNCHGPHTVSKNPLSAGLNNSDISDPTNTLNPFTTATGDMSAFCLKCHNGSPPAAVNDGSAFVPYSVIFPDLNFTSTAGGWNKSSYTGSGHYAAGYQCDKCHGNHGADYARLTLLPEDGSGAPTGTSGICLQCHGNQSGRPAGAADVYTDLTSGADFTYRHPTLDVSGKHSDTETYPQAAADRNANCNDCHDPHAADQTTASDGNASGKIAGTTGVTPAYPATNTPLAAASSYSFGSVTKEYQLCFKCHTGYNGNFPAPPAGAVAETDLAKEFNPANPSFHDVGLYTGAARDYVGSFQSGTNMTGSTVLYCSSCHGADSGSSTLQATSGPVHGSTNQYILKGTWNSSLTLSSSTASNNLCLKCHDVKSGSSRFTNRTRNLHALSKHANASCQSCHSEVPHGGKRPSLITIMPSSPITGAYQYDASYDGVYGKNSKLSLKAWKSGGTYWKESDCGGCHG